jgi:hypothetical protein
MDLLSHFVICILESLTEGLDTHSRWEHRKRNKPNQSQCSFNSPERVERGGAAQLQSPNNCLTLIIRLLITTKVHLVTFNIIN